MLCGIFAVNGQIATDGGNVWGLFCGAMSALTYAVMVICNKKSAPITGLENALLQLVVSFVTLSVFIGIR